MINTYDNLSLIKKKTGNNENKAANKLGFLGEQAIIPFQPFP
jgi:hypothetical protein